MLVITCLMGAPAFGQAVPAAEPTGRIAGRVIVEGTNTAIAGARIILLPVARPMGPMGPPPQAVTDQDGRYVFERLGPGDYRVDLQKTGYAPPDRMGGRMIQVAAGQSIAGLDFQLQKGGVIAGRLLDPSSEPLPNARIMASVSGSGGGFFSFSSGTVGGIERPTEVVVTDADVKGVRVVIRRPAP